MTRLPGISPTSHHAALTDLIGRIHLDRRGTYGTRRVPGMTTTADLVERRFGRDGPGQLWVTDITVRPTREGKVSCAVVLAAWSRRVVGWSIDASPPAAS